MDDSVVGFKLDSNHICNYCTEFLSRSKNSPTNIQRTGLLDLIDKIKKNGKGKDYDCVVGISGGIDSSIALHNCIELGLRPIATHMDNGWNSNLAQENIQSLIEKLNVDLYTCVVDWNEYKDLMQSFFNADVVDIELLMDNAMLATNYFTAKKFNLKYILSGMNFSTEGLKMPNEWNWLKYDKKNIRSIARESGIKTFKTYPSIGVIDLARYMLFSNPVFIPFLDYFIYDKNTSLDLLIDKYNYKPYPYKHYESIFTRFYQGYILPKKFNIDKRKVHLSTLVASGQMNRLDALDIIKTSPYISDEELNADIKYFLKKMNWTKDELDNYLSRPPRLHSEYGNSLKLWNFLKKIKLKIDSFFEKCYE